jgi:hypothetical protein
MRAALQTNKEVAQFDRFIAQLSLDPYTQVAAQQLRHAMTLEPMSKVLDLVPGSSITMKAMMVGVSRNTWYGWNRGEIRPNKRQAKRLEQLTGVKAERFQGRR